MRILIVGTGSMAAFHATRFAAIDGVQIVAAVDVLPEVLARFCAKHQIANSFASVAEALAWGGFDAATVVTPDATHKDAVLPLLAAGKHVLCEKPLAPNHADAREMTAAAEEAGVINMVNFTYRKSGALYKAHELVKSGRIGAIKHAQASYLQSWLAQDAWGKWDEEDRWLWRLSSRHGSLGVLGDVGVHLLDFLTFAANDRVSSVSCHLETFHKAEGDRIGEYELDANDTAVMTARLGGGGIAVLQASRYMTGYINQLKLLLHGDQGALEVTMGDHPEAIDSLRGCLDENLPKGAWQQLETEPVPYVVERFAAAVKEGVQGDPPFATACAMQEILDLAFASNEKGHTAMQIS